MELALQKKKKKKKKSNSSLIPKLQHIVYWQFTQLSIRPSVRNNDCADATTI
jgi:hypothetical protein